MLQMIDMDNNIRMQESEVSMHRYGLHDILTILVWSSAIQTVFGLLFAIGPSMYIQSPRLLPFILANKGSSFVYFQPAYVYCIWILPISPLMGINSSNR